MRWLVLLSLLLTACAGRIVEYRVNRCDLEERAYEARALADANARHKLAPYACIWLDGTYHVDTGQPFDEERCIHIPPPLGADCAFDCKKLGAGCWIHYAKGVSPKSISYSKDNCDD